MRPPHAYVPGRTERHPDGLFDAIRATAEPGLSEAALSATEAFRLGLDYLREGYGWEAHEVLEAVWMACPPNAPHRLFVQGLIQLANADVKQRMEQPAAAARLRVLARGLLTEAARGATAGRIMGERVATYLAMCEDEHEDSAL